jgi:ATP-binding cassette subfamily B protein
MSQSLPNDSTRRRNLLKDVLGFLFVHWKQQAGVVTAIAMTMTLATAADLLLPVLSGRLVDAIASRSLTHDAAIRIAIQSIAGMAALGLLLLVCRHLTMLGIVRLTLRIMARMASDAFWRVQRFSTDWHANHFGGSVVRRITRGMWAVDLMDDTLIFALLPAAMVLAGSSLILALRWPGMGLLVAAGAICYTLFSVSLSLNYVAPSARLSNAMDTKMGGAIADAITCNAVVKAFGAEHREDFRLARVLDKWSRRTRRHWVRGANSGSLQMAMLLGFRMLIMSYAAWLWWIGRASPGDVTFVLTSYFVIHGYLRDIGQQVRNLQRSANEMEEMIDFHAQPLGIADRERAYPMRVTRGEIVFERVVFRYGAHVGPLFRNLNLVIEAGERVGLIGHSGSGKSTFVKLLHRLYDIDGGHIVIDGQDISCVTQQSLRAQLALVPQEPILFHRTLAENIAYARPEASLREIEEAARLANAHEFILRQPKGYATLVGERGVKLSGGERQRVALARAFLANTPILILDEATSSLDSESEALIQEAMERLMAGRTSIVIAHRLSTVRMLDRILVFDNGEIVEEGTHESLVQQPDGAYKRLFDKQVMGLLIDTEPDLSEDWRDSAMAP